jgi:hypothetical protein
MSKIESRTFAGIFGLDSGYGIDKYAFRDLGGKIQFGKISSAIAKAPMDAEDMPFFEGQRYYLGDVALMESSNNIIDVIDYKEHEKFAPLSLWHAFDENKIDYNNVTRLATGLSLAQKDVSAKFLKRVTKFIINGIKYDFIDKISLLPQGIGAKFAIDNFFYKDLADQTYAIVDIGQLTVDIVCVINGKTREENASGKTHDGIIKITQDLREVISLEHGVVLSMKEVQETLLTKKYICYGVEYDYSKQIDSFKKSYTKYLIATLKQRNETIFKKYPKIYFVGGGAYYVDKDVLEEEFKTIGTFVFPENAEYLNAIGNLLYGEKRAEELKNISLKDTDPKNKK